MKHSLLSTLTTTAAMLSLLFTVGCASPINAGGDVSSVAEAYNSPNIIHVKPYTRTIFSTTDF